MECERRQTDIALVHGLDSPVLRTEVVSLKNVEYFHRLELTETTTTKRGEEQPGASPMVGTAFQALGSQGTSVCSVWYSFLFHFLMSLLVVRPPSSFTARFYPCGEEGMRSFRIADGKLNNIRCLILVIRETLTSVTVYLLASCPNSNVPSGRHK